MLKNYLTTALRNLRKHKLYSAINIIGLATGMAACIVIMLFVYYERSFDNFQTKNIYRLSEVQKFPGMVASQKVGLSMFPMGPTMKQDFPEILNFTRVNWEDQYLVNFGEKKVYYPRVYYVDTSFLDMFNFPLLSGDKKTVLLRPNSAVLTESAAQKLFGKENPVGKSITHYGFDTLTFTVTGVLKDVPQNSQFQFDGLFSFNTKIRPDWINNWGGNWLDTYFEMAPNTNTAALEKQFPDYLKRRITGYEAWKFYELFLVPLKEIHSNTSDIGLDYINYQKFDRKYTNIFLIIALIVLAIACINFMNLSTARSAERAKEVGVRKSIGAQRYQLGVQFLAETVLLALTAMLLAIVLVYLSLPYIRNLSQRDLGALLSDHPGLFLTILSGTIVLGLISGLYPAVYLSSFQPSKVLKGSVSAGNKKSGFRNMLVISQFASAVFLIISTLFVFRQLNYMQKKDPGFVRDEVVTVPLENIPFEKYSVIKDKLSASSLVSHVTASIDQLGGHLDQTGVQFRGDGPQRQLAVTCLIVDADYLNLYKIGLLYGSNFSREKEASGNEYILNESLAKELLKDKPGAPLSSLIGKEFGFDSAGRIVGIVKDFNFNSLHYKIETIFLNSRRNFGYRMMSVKINGGKEAEALDFIASTWKSVLPDRPYSYQFLDDHFREVYRTDSQITQMVGILAALAIFISCLGLFGLASYAAEKRVKEIGVRKVLGASVTDIITLLSRHFIKLVLIANAIAWPLAWLTVNRWMQDYAYRLPLSWWIFLLAGGIALAIALLTVSLLARKAAMANPVQSLRSE
ncbi:MAG TPA: ABC transporter permease [Puia sp.]|nr:ABC transporter permease [Puia sp.]